MLKYINDTQIDDDNSEDSKRLESMFASYAVKISQHIHSFIIDITEHLKNYSITNVNWHNTNDESDKNDKAFSAVALIDTEHEFLAVTRHGDIFYVTGNFRPETPNTKYDIVSVPYLELTDKFSITDYEANKLARCVDYFDKKLEIL